MARPASDNGNGSSSSGSPGNDNRRSAFTGGYYTPSRSRIRYSNTTPPTQNPAHRAPQPPRPSLRPVTRNSDTQLRVFVRNLPPCDTAFVFEQLQRFGNIVKIEIPDPRPQDREDSRIAHVFYKPIPRDTTWIQRGLNVECGDTTRFLHFEAKDWQPNLHASPIDPGRKFYDQITVAATHLGLGVMESESVMLEFYAISAPARSPTELTMNIYRKCVDVQFSHIAPPTTADHRNGVQYEFKMRINLPQIKSIINMQNETTGEKALIITTTMPPLLFRKATNEASTHEPAEKHWTDWQTWYRQTGIAKDRNTSRTAVVQLQKQDSVIDFGRWLTYKLVFSADAASSKEFSELCDALHHHNISIQTNKIVEFEFSGIDHLWNWLDNPTAVSKDTMGSSALIEMHQMANQTTQLPFGLRYQLEACISNGVLHECNIDREFLDKLDGLDPKPGPTTRHSGEYEEPKNPAERATKLLEKVAEEKSRIYNPMDIFPRFLHKASIVKKRVPAYCASIRSAIVTPTTVYFQQGTVETSNNIIRKYRHYENRFLRVKFTDEQYNGKIMSNESGSTDELFTRIKRAMTNGINVGGRQYEFLAFGNSQFREGGAYFFASIAGCSAQDIRNAMGDFSKVERTVARYCARVGQAFATTRALRLKVKVENIPDIERNGYCFTDGVGKLSPLLAQLIAQEHGLPTSSGDYPSVFQFRLGGCKGVLAVDPTLTGKVIQIRPSQRKFEIPNQFLGLDICRISQLSAANLNMQLILVLSTLGVEDRVFRDKMQDMLQDLSIAMTNEQKALELLQRNIDFNQMTIQLAQMVFDGFMEVKDPFMITCLRLWRAWSIKYLKEKARIYIEQGAFVLGCVDETGTLKGHFDNDQDRSNVYHDEASLPEIFLRIEQPPGSGQWTVITGECILARNPSLHPGDVRVVKAVDKSELYHYKNCVVLPQTGDRDLANMCSGGDLDGDDYLVSWDQDLLPDEWNHPAMNFTGAIPKESDGPVDVNDMTSFFVTFMRYNNLSRIAVAHRYWADASEDGVKDRKCLELAALHSTAVDYVKSGVPAEMGRHLKVRRWPHWAEVKGRPASKTYHSEKILGQLYDKVQLVDMHSAWDFEFDHRILDAYELDGEILNLARKAKQEYDSAVLRIMAKFSIKTEFEVWTTFVMEHSNDYGDYKFAETIGEETQLLKDYHQQMCYELAGTDRKDKEYSKKIGPFVAAIYTVTKQEMDAALEDCKKVKLVRGVQVPLREKTAAYMPLISFPWLFPRELGVIANKDTGPREGMAGLQQPMTSIPKKTKQSGYEPWGSDFAQDLPPEVPTATLTSSPDQTASTPAQPQSTPFEEPALQLQSIPHSNTRSMPPDGTGDRIETSDNYHTQEQLQTSTSSPDPINGVSRTMDAVKLTGQDSTMEAGDSDEEMNEANRVTISVVEKSPFDDLDKLMGM